MVQKLLSTIYKVDQNFGVMHVINILRGIYSEKIRRWQHERLSTFGIGKEHSEAEWRSILRQSIALILIAVDHNAYGEASALRLTDLALPVLRGEQQLQLKEYQKPIYSQYKTPKYKNSTRVYFSEPEQENFERLRRWRFETARKHSVPAYFIFHDTTMREIVRDKPASLYDLRSVNGIGDRKLKIYGTEIIELINK
jgi:ATP-dependent DNA helicase RecQ